MLGFEHKFSRSVFFYHFACLFLLFFFVVISFICECKMPMPCWDSPTHTQLKWFYYAVPWCCIGVFNLHILSIQNQISDSFSWPWLITSIRTYIELVFLIIFRRKNWFFVRENRLNVLSIFHMQMISILLHTVKLLYVDHSSNK